MPAAWPAAPPSPQASAVVHVHFEAASAIVYQDFGQASSTGNKPSIVREHLIINYSQWRLYICI